MSDASSAEDLVPERNLSAFERNLTWWVAGCMVAGVALGYLFPILPLLLDSMSLEVGGAPVVSIPIAICLFFMMFPIMVKIDFDDVARASRNAKPVGLTLFVNWAIKPFTMYALAFLFLGTVFIGFIGPETMDTVRMPFAANGLPSGESEIPMWRSLLAGCILLGIAPCTAMVLVWGSLARGSDGHTLVMVAVNSLTMLFLYGILGGFLLGMGKLPTPWEALALSVAVYVALPLVAGYVVRKLVIARKGKTWFEEVLLPKLSPVSITALLATLIVLFSLKGEVILDQPLIIAFVAVPIFLNTVLVFGLTYLLAKYMKLSYEDAAPSALIGASNHFEVAIASAVMLFGLSSAAALATVVGVLIEVPVMLWLVSLCRKTKSWFPNPA